MNRDGETVRLAKLMAHRGICSRREAEGLIDERRVEVDGHLVDRQGLKVDPDARIRILGEPSAAWFTVLLNKPVGYVSGQPEPGKSPAVRLITRDRFMGEKLPRGFTTRGLAPAGRLDIDSEGLLVLTSEGRIARLLVGDSAIEKEYLVRVTGEIRPPALERLRHGMELDGRPLKSAIVEALPDNRLKIILTEGRKRQIRRMCDEVNLQVVQLKRVRIGGVRLGGLPRGRWRLLRPGESFA